MTTTYLRLEDTHPDHRLMWNAFREGRRAVEALHGPSVIPSDPGQEVNDQLPVLLSLGHWRMAAVWFLPNEAGTKINNGFHLDYRGQSRAGGSSWVIAAWSTDIGRVELRLDRVHPPAVLNVLRMVELIP